MPETEDKSKMKQDALGAYERVAKTAERVGVPIATFAVGAVMLIVATMRSTPPILSWLGSALVIASLLTYIWLTGRSTIKVQSQPPPIPAELKGMMDWMKEELGKQNAWARELINGKQSATYEVTARREPS